MPTREEELKEFVEDARKLIHTTPEYVLTRDRAVQLWKDARLELLEYQIEELQRKQAERESVEAGEID